MIKTLTLAAGILGAVAFAAPVYAVVGENGNDRGPYDDFEVPEEVTLGVLVGGGSIGNLPTPKPDDEKNFEFNIGISSDSGTPPADWQLTLSGGGNIDPFHSLDVVATDFGAPTDFAFSLVTPFLFALTGNVDVFGLASIDARDSAGAPDGGTVTPDVLLSLHFVDHVIFGSGAGEAFAFSLLDTAITYPVDGSDDEDETVSFVFDCGTFASGECAAIGTFIGVGGAGGGDGFSVLTTLRVEEIPVPSALALLGFGLVGIGAARRVQRA